MMIRVNLLPQDYRKKTATPMAVLLPTVGAITLVLLAGFGWAWLHFAELAKVDNDLSDLQGTLASKAPALAYVAKLKEEHADFENRKSTIKEIASSRVLWTKKLDELFDIATNGTTAPRAPRFRVRSSRRTCRTRQASRSRSPARTSGGAARTSRASTSRG